MTWTRCACTETSAGECSQCEASQRERHATGFALYESADSSTADAARRFNESLQRLERSVRAMRAAQDHRHIYARYNRKGRQ